MENEISERRAKFVHDAARLAAIAAGALIVSQPWLWRDEDFKSRFVSVVERECGTGSTSPSELQGRWMKAYLEMGWMYGDHYDVVKRTHPDLVPYDQLPILERDKYEIFMSLCKIARRFIRT